MDTPTLVRTLTEEMQRPHAPYPYLVVRLMPAVYGIAPLPASLDRESLIVLAQTESRALMGERSMCLVFAEDDALYIGSDGTPYAGPRPWGGHKVAWTLKGPTLLPTHSLAVN